MKKIVLVVVLILYTFTSCIFNLNVYADNSKVSSASETEKPKESGNDENYIPRADYMLVCDVDSGFKIYSKDSSKIINPYGLTKILTAITVIETEKNLDKEITVAPNILKNYDYTYGNIGLMSGEKISIKNLISAMIMHDAGDCAIALAHGVGKSYEEFIKKMNDIAKKLDAKSSVFTEPAGFNNSIQKTSLDDMAKITSYALKNEIFAEIAKKQRLEIAPTNKCTYMRVLFSKNYFLSRFYSEDYFDQRITGVKGYRKDDTDTGLVIRYTSGNDDILILTAKSNMEGNTNYAYEDTLHLIKKGKDYFTKVKIANKEDFVYEAKLKTAKGTDRVLVICLDNITVKLPKEYKNELITKEIKLRENLDAPINKYEEIGEMNVYYDGFKVGSTKVAAYNKIEKSTLKLFKNSLVNFIKSIYFWIVLLIIYVIVYNKKRKSKSRKNVKGKN